MAEPETKFFQSIGQSAFLSFFSLSLASLLAIMSPQLADLFVGRPTRDEDARRERNRPRSCVGVATEAALWKHLGGKNGVGRRNTEERRVIGNNIVAGGPSTARTLPTTGGDDGEEGRRAERLSVSLHQWLAEAKVTHKQYRVIV